MNPPIRRDYLARQGFHERNPFEQPAGVNEGSISFRPRSARRAARIPA